MFSLGFVGGEVYHRGKLMPLNLYLEGDRIGEISHNIHEAKELVHMRGKWLLPGFIDPHVHFNLDLGEFISGHNFLQGSIEALKGGITTYIDFLDPIHTEDSLKGAFAKRKEQAQDSVIDYSFHTTLGDFGGDVAKLVDKSLEFGLPSIKVFTTYKSSGRMIGLRTLRALLDKEEIVTLVHAEDDDLIDEKYSNIDKYGDGRPLSSELKAIDTCLKLLGKGNLYLVHVSSGSGVELLSGRSRVYVESAPHYFYFDEEVFKEPDGAKYLLAPPFRNEIERIKLVSSIDSVHVIGTDHCPFSFKDKLKYQDASKVPKGIGGIKYSFLLMYNLFGLRAIDKMTSNPARIMGIENKGSLEEDYIGDLVVFDPLGTTRVDEEDEFYLYKGRLKGKIEEVYARGKRVLVGNEVLGGRGQFIERR